jgi:hypothetical protein
MRYAQFDPDTKLVHTVGQGSSVPGGTDIISIPDDAPDPMGKIWNGTSFEDPPPPASQNTIRRQEFIDRWDFEELVSLKGLVAQAAGQSPSTSALEAAVFWDQVMARKIINLDSALSSSAKVALVAWGVLTSERADQIFA